MAKQSEKDIKWWREQFDKYDRDLDGGLTMKELERMMQYFGYNPTEKVLKQYMKEMDKNGDDEIDFQEFYDFMSKEPDPWKELETAFQFHDKNGDGFLDKAEMKGILSSGNCATEEEVDDLFKLVDENNDGKIQLNEFIKLFQNVD